MTVDTTLQPKVVAHPLDSRLYHRGRELLVRLAARHGIKLRQSYQRPRKHAFLANRYVHARQMRPARREINGSKPFSAVSRATFSRELAARPGLVAQFEQPLARVQRLLAQQKTDHAKLYALHAPEVACLAKSLAPRDSIRGACSSPGSAAT